MQTRRYISCIYLNGEPILPPLLSAEQRHEMQQYRKEAINIEKQIQLKRSLIEQSKESDPSADMNPSAEEEEQLKICDEIMSKINMTPDKFDKDVFINSTTEKIETENEENCNRLRRNSYTLESPSPQLIAFLKTNMVKDVEQCFESKSDMSVTKSSLSLEHDKRSESFILDPRENRHQSSQLIHDHSFTSVSNIGPQSTSDVPFKVSSTSTVSSNSEYNSPSSEFCESVAGLNINSVNTDDPVSKEESCSVDSQKTEFDSPHSCQSEPNNTTKCPSNWDKNFNEFISHLDTSKIRDLKLSRKSEVCQEMKNSKIKKKKGVDEDFQRTSLSHTNPIDKKVCSISLPSSLSSSPVPKNSFQLAERNAFRSAKSRLPTSNSIPSRLQKLSEKSHCSFKSAPAKSFSCDLKAKGTLNRKKLHTSLIGEKINISDDSKSILNQSKLPVYVPLRSSSLGFLPFKSRSAPSGDKQPKILRKNNPYPGLHSDQRKIKKDNPLKPRIKTNVAVNSRSLKPSIFSDKSVLDENKNSKKHVSPLINKISPKCQNNEENYIFPSQQISSKFCPIGSSSVREESKLKAFVENKSSPRSVLVQKTGSDNNISKNNDSLYSKSDSKNYSDENLQNLSEIFDVKEKRANISDPVISSSFLFSERRNQSDVSTLYDKTNLGSRKKLNFNCKENAFTPNNSMNKSINDSTSESGYSSNILISQDTEMNAKNFTGMSDNKLTLLLEGLQKKHQQQMKLLFEKHLSEQTLLEEEQRRITEVILSNLLSDSDTCSRSSVPESIKNEDGLKNINSFSNTSQKKNNSISSKSNISSISSNTSISSFREITPSRCLSIYPRRLIPNKIRPANFMSPKFIPKSNYNDSEIKAAIILQAAVRGYFVRRLMKTERVQLLIEMIQKSIACALEIQGEFSPTMADYEFHSRLVQQITKASYEIHEIFVLFSQKERLSIIAADRTRRLQKLNSTPVVKPLTIATRRSLQRKHSQ